MRSGTVAVLMGAVLACSVAVANEAPAASPSGSGDAQSRPGESAAPAAGRAFHLALFAGSASIASTDVRGTYYTCTFCGASTLQARSAEFSDATLKGLRLEAWFDRWGVAAEFAAQGGVEGVSARDPGTKVKLAYSSFALLGLARTSMLPAPDAPQGRLDVYGGAGLARVTTQINFQTAQTSRGASTDNSGTMLLLGTAYKFGSVRAFFEVRKLDVVVDDTYAKMGDMRLDTHLSSMEKVLGVAIAF